MFARIIGTGSYLPEKCLTNADLESMVETTDEWIFTRTGIRQRHIAAEGQLTSDLALEASKKALEAAGVAADSIDLIIVATTTPDLIFPSTACILQQKLGAMACPAFDVQAVCSGFVYALATAEKFIKTGAAKRALVVGAETLSRIVDWNDRTTCVLFGDGAGAVVLEASEETGILSSVLKADGNYLPLLNVPGQVRGGEVTGSPFIKMDGQGVFKFAVRSLGEVGEEALRSQGLDKSQLDWLIPHQANARIIEATAKKLGLPMDKVVLTVDKQGNTSAASIPLAIDEAARSGKLKRNDLIMLEGIGGGFAWGAILLRW
ncbi:ketoacyl-ACP synthase III [Leeia sp. TBRC 13508]|uniref:Beta-ketoacyl-[acyl-carrier-protein] synthase III n=1 Tax=Leeia speluncae TaxID=2884804 RepID=A0ABS8D827_9NEIS|nr:beta-ketoacyl-ACP synthase III [Leeia speluncae]MCB6184370.1 ketoacyl-ACP synthase III [Leeia speluncae]